MQKVSYLLIIVLNLFMAFSLIGQNSKQDDVKALQEKLKNKDFRIRIPALKKLSAKVPDKEVRKILIDSYSALPLKRQKGRAPEIERSIILQALVKDNPAGTEELISKVLGEELKGFLDWETGKREYEYPVKVMFTLYELIPEYYLNSNTIREKVNQTVTDKGTPFTVKLPNGKTHSGIARLPLHVRQRLSEINILFEVKNIDDANAKIDHIIKNINPLPACPIPHEIYKSQEKRVAYGKTEAIKRKRNTLGKLLRTNKGIRAFGAELALKNMGREAVNHILELIETGNFDKDKKHVLMKITAEIMYNHLMKQKKYSDEDEAVITVIKEYVSEMKDTGVFGRRFNIQRVLNSIVDKKQKFASEMDQ